MMGLPARSSIRRVAIEAAWVAGVSCAAGLAVLFLFFEAPWSVLARNWFITPVAIVAATFANATAVGGGFIFVPLFLFGLDLTALQSLKLSLASQAFGMTSGALGWSRTFILPGPLLAAALTSGAGMVIGTFVVPADASMIKGIFGWVALGIAAALALEMRFGDRQVLLRVEARSFTRDAGYALACLVGGVLTAWVSIGIGEVVALYLLFVYRIRIEAAIATGVAALAIDSILGFAFHANLGGIHWEYLVFTAPGCVLGGRYGARLGRWVEGRGNPADLPGAPPNHASPLKWLFVAVCVVDGIGMLLQPFLQP
ncbi:MAG: sulfite exporter TauE/SafE family protein [Myxococcales bacterium]|nr:sulfite exporter TauE/SafE family protein [Myxococcales bacterium]